MTDKKTAEAELKTAEKAWTTTSAKADKARDVYLNAQLEANAAARTLDWARANPALYDDDPLTVVSPGGSVGPVVAGKAYATSDAEFAKPLYAVGGVVAPQAPPAPQPVTPSPAAPVVNDEPHGEDGAWKPADEGGEIVSTTEVPVAPWEAAQAPAAPAAEAPVRRKRRTKAEIAADAAAAALVEIQQPDVPAPQEIPAAPWEQAQGVIVQPAPQPVAEAVIVGYDPQTGAPIMGEPPVPVAAPPAAPWETGAAPLY